jgi:hypothetical protein
MRLKFYPCLNPSCDASRSTEFTSRSLWQRSLLLIFFGALSTFSPTIASAALDWQTTIREFKATAGDQEVVAEFHFTNAGTAPVSIVGIQTSCDCTAATSSTSTIAPGASGHVKAVFTIGDRIGRQEKTIEVSTSDQPAPTVLVLRVNVAEVVTANPRVLIWKLQQPAAEKIVVFRATGDHRLETISPVPDTKGFSCRLQSNEDAREFKLHVTPLSTSAPAAVIIRLTAQVEGRPPTALAVYAVVK